MLSPKYSRLLAKKRLIALFNKDFEMIKKIENIKNDSDVTEEMLNYKLKERKNKNMNDNVLEEILTASNKEKVFDKYNVIFVYMLKNAWSQPLSIVYVTDDKENNLHLIKDLDNEVISTINVEELNTVLFEHVNDFEKSIKISLPHSMILDGYINEVYFKVDNNWHNDTINNLFYYDGKDLDENKHLSGVIKLLDDTYEALYKQNKQIEEFFILSEPEEDDEEDTE